MSTPQAPASPCYRHPGRGALVRCARCGRNICPDCMREAAVGHQCPDCAGSGNTTGTPGRLAASNAPVTKVLIAMNVAMFALQTFWPDAEHYLALWPPAVASGELYRLGTSAFVHYGVLHIMLNMWALYCVGPALEAWLGRLRFSALYLLSALGGSVLVYLLASLNSATAGASGAVFGLFGATFVVARHLQLNVRPLVAVIGANLIFTFVVPLLSSQAISWQGHIGGLVTGFVVALGFVYAPREHRNLWTAGVIVACLVVFVVLIWWRTGELLTELSQSGVGGH